MQTRFLEESPKTPFRLSVPIDGNQTLRLTGNVRFQYQGTGSIGSGTIALSLVPTEQLTWSSEIESSGIIWVSGNMAISEMFVSHIPLATIPLQEIATDNETYVIVTSQTNIVLARPFAPGYRLTDEKQTFSPVATIEGLNLFQNVTSGNYHIDFSPLQVIQVTYSATLVFSFSLLLVLSGGTARLGINSGLMLKRLRSIVKLGPKSSKGRQTALS